MPISSPLLDCVEVTTGPDPRRAVIWLHGLGADGHDFEPLVPQLDLAGVPAVRFVFPNAPVQPVTINGGFAMRSWYDIRHPNIAQREDEAGIRASRLRIDALIAREVERGIPARHIVLAGFSQGCAMTLFTGLRHGEQLAGLIGLSGYVPVPYKLADERARANDRTPIFMGHGLTDPTVPLERAEASRQLLVELGYDLTWRTYPMNHAVCQPEVTDVSNFLRKTLA